MVAHLESRGTRRPNPQPERSLRRYVSPCVRRLVDVTGVEVRSIDGTGRDSRVTRADVLAHLHTRAQDDLTADAGVSAMDGSMQPRSTAFMSVEVDLTAAGEVSEGESLVALAVAVGRVLGGEQWSRQGLPHSWATSLCVRRRGAPRAIDVHAHRLLSAAGLRRIIERDDDADDPDAETAPRSRLVIASTSHPSLTSEGTALQSADAATIVLGAAHRRPAVVDTAAGEVLALRRLATLTLTYDAGVVSADGAVWLLTELVGVLDVRPPTIAATLDVGSPTPSTHPHT